MQSGGRHVHQKFLAEPSLRIWLSTPKAISILETSHFYHLWIPGPRNLRIKWLFFWATRFWVVCYAAINNLNRQTGGYNLVLGSCLLLEALALIGSRVQAHQLLWWKIVSSPSLGVSAESLEHSPIRILSLAQWAKHIHDPYLVEALQ